MTGIRRTCAEQPTKPNSVYFTNNNTGKSSSDVLAIRIFLVILAHRTPTTLLKRNCSSSFLTCPLHHGGQAKNRRAVPHFLLQFIYPGLSSMVDRLKTGGQSRYFLIAPICVDGFACGETCYHQDVLGYYAQPWFFSAPICRGSEKINPYF